VVRPSLNVMHLEALVITAKRFNIAAPGRAAHPGCCVFFRHRTPSGPSGSTANASSRTPLKLVPVGHAPHDDHAHHDDPGSRHAEHGLLIQIANQRFGEAGPMAESPSGDAARHR
jgi:hypothetical protein